MNKTAAQRVDVAIIGGGIAGAALAHQLRLHDQSLMLIDDPASAGASRVAAGLMTPVTGAKLRPQADFDALITVATALYRDAERRSGRTLLWQRPALRLLSSARELDAFRQADPSLTAQMRAWHAALPHGVRSVPAAALMPRAARLDVSAYVDSVRDQLRADGCWLDARIDTQEVIAGTDGIRIEALNLTAQKLVFCRGFADRDNPFFPGLEWRPAKGQILTVRCGALSQQHTLHGCGMWLTPVGDDRFLAGATYEWDTLDEQATDGARDNLLERLGQLLSVACTVIDQHAGVRPIVAGRRPVIGASPLQPQIFLCNGLGSKGALFAPTVTASLVSHMLDGRPLDARFDLAARVAATCD